MKKILFILAIILSSNFINCIGITLTNPVLKIVDGVKGLMDANNVHKILYIGQAINKFLNGEIDPETKKRVPQHNFSGKLYTLIELVKIEEDFEKKYGPIYENQNSQKNSSPFGMSNANYRDRSEGELQQEDLIDLPEHPADNNQTKKGGRPAAQNLDGSSLVQHPAIQNLSKEKREQYEKEKKNLIDTLAELKEKFLKETGPFLKDARGTKEQMFRLIQEWSEKASRPDSLLLGWSSEEEGASFKRNVTSIKKLHTFCLDLTDFLKVLVQSCPKALKAFMKDNPNYKLAHAKL